ncbi:M23 family metallopeptidase [Arcobacter sp. FWKO B]|uniref:M23 family metallopeptidase n=1 Tax=Arcobacter sp. FWKO B TaxID=2593672 RepID=UPI0018A4132D|nr:M23 family metallopeptidase [Arcobacter sp. FWKO B]QOG12110.1 M23 family metallopeptidase [Arcobacter sp. FWKO B]
MKNRLIITISDAKGTKSYTVSKLVRKLLIWILLVVVVIATISIFVIPFLGQKLYELDNENKTYYQELEGKNQDLELLDSKLQEIESQMNILLDPSQSPIERAKVARITAANRAYTLRVIPSGSPLDEVYVTSPFGNRIHPTLKVRQFHRGIDLRASVGTPVYSTADGVVRQIHNTTSGAFGRVITISHSYGFETVYAHLSKINVKIGEVVRKGDIIALSGNSGRSSGPHLHYEVRYATQHLNPYDFIKWDVANYEGIFEKQRSVSWESLINLIELQNKLTLQQ